MAETRETVTMDITLLTKFAAAQRITDVDKSAFSAIQNLRQKSDNDDDQTGGRC